MILGKFSASFRRDFPELVGRPVLVALSGGADSVALLVLFVLAADELGCAPVGGHVHHHLRGAAADADAAFCVSLGARLGVPVVVQHLDPRPRPGISPEAHWRERRYALLEELRQRHGCAAVATAHTRDDQAETVLLKLLRGAGPRGVAGIRRRRGMVVRPLLDLPRTALREWLAARDTDWREDATNLQDDRPRTWLRHRLLPLIAGQYPTAIEHLAAFAGGLAEDEGLLASQLVEAGRWPVVGNPISLAAVASLPRPLRQRWVLELARRLPLAEPPSRKQLDDAAGVIAGSNPAAVDLGRRWVLRRRAGKLHLCPPPCTPFAPAPATVPSRVELLGGFVARLGAEVTGAGRAHAWLHPRIEQAVLLWRSPLPGERWRGGKRLSRLLAAAGVVAEWRRAWPVLEADGTMVWVPAVGVQPDWVGDEGSGIAAELEVPWEHRER